MSASDEPLTKMTLSNGERRRGLRNDEQVDRLRGSLVHACCLVMHGARKDTTLVSWLRGRLCESVGPSGCQARFAHKILSLLVRLPVSVFPVSLVSVRQLCGNGSVA